MSGKCSEGLWKVSGRCPEGVWKISGRFLEGVRTLFGRHLEGIWKASEGLWKISVWCLEGLLEYHPVSVGDFGIFLIIQFPSSTIFFQTPLQTCESNST